MIRRHPWCLLSALLLAAGVVACAPPPVPVFNMGQPALTINWPLDPAREGTTEVRERAGALQDELLLQLRASGRFARIEVQSAGQTLMPSPAAGTDVVLDTTLEQLDLRYEYGRYPYYPYYGFGHHRYLGGRFFWHPWYDPWFDPWYDNYYNSLCAVAKVHAVLRDARSGEVYLEKSWWDRSCRYDRDSRIGRERLYGTLGREALIKVVDQLTEAVEELFY